MRSVVERAKENNKFGREFRKRLDGPLAEKSWAITKLIYANVEPKEITEIMEAEQLARKLNSRMTNLLSRNANVTAKALVLYDPDLPAALMKAWGRKVPKSFHVYSTDLEDTEDVEDDPYELPQDVNAGGGPDL